MSKKGYADDKNKPQSKTESRHTAGTSCASQRNPGRTSSGLFPANGLSLTRRPPTSTPPACRQTHSVACVRHRAVDRFRLPFVPHSEGKEQVMSLIDAQQLKFAIPPGEFYFSELVRMPVPRRSTGWTRGGLCPFHPDRSPGSVSVHLQSGGYICFSCGTRATDVIDFAMRRYGLGFTEAIHYLSLKWGLT